MGPATLSNEPKGNTTHGLLSVILYIYYIYIEIVDHLK